jgi:hypothetical protein
LVTNDTDGYARDPMKGRGGVAFPTTDPRASEAADADADVLRLDHGSGAVRDLLVWLPRREA